MLRLKSLFTTDVFVMVSVRVVVFNATFTNISVFALYFSTDCCRKRTVIIVADNNGNTIKIPVYFPTVRIYSKFKYFIAQCTNTV